MLGAIAFSGKAIIVKLAYRYGVDAVTLIMYRMLFALPIFALMAWWSSRGKPAPTRQDWWGILGLGVTGYYLASFLDFAGLAYISASLERLILYLNPTLVLLRPWSAALVAPEVIWLSVLNATLCTAVPVLMVMMAIEHIGAILAAQAGMVGPDVHHFDGCRDSGRAVHRLGGGWHGAGGGGNICFQSQRALGIRVKTR